MNKAQLIEKLQEMDRQLESIISVLEKKHPEEAGTLHCLTRKDRVVFYHKKEAALTYLGHDKDDIIRKLAQKTYDERSLEAAKREKHQIERCLKTLNENRGLADIDKVLQTMHESIRGLVTPLQETDEAYAKKWYRFYSRFANQKKVLRSPLKTAKGETVKSKSEIIIADRLNLAGVPYVYEMTMTFDEGDTMRYPDFFILNKRTRKEYIWEHQGMMDDKNYCLDSQLKLEVFARKGYLLGKNLIFTYEGSSRQLSTEYVDLLIKEYLV